MHNPNVDLLISRIEPQIKSAHFANSDLVMNKTWKEEIVKTGFYPYIYLYKLLNK